MVSDPFNLMPIIEHIQKGGRNNQRRKFRASGGRVTPRIMQAKSHMGGVVILPEIGKRFV